MTQFHLIVFLHCGLLALAEKTTVEDEKVALSVRSPYYLPPPQQIPAPVNIFHPHQNNPQDCYGRFGGYGCGGIPHHQLSNIHHPTDFPQPQLLSPLIPDPFLDAYLLSTSVGLRHTPRLTGFNHLDHLPLNPYLALLLSHYGRYAPVYGTGRGIYGYAAANNYHNNKPFGSYKILDDHY